jgi:hypothetical protein
MTGLSLTECLTRNGYTWRYRCIEACLHNEELELCISIVTGHMTYKFCRIVRLH